MGNVQVENARSQRACEGEASAFHRHGAPAGCQALGRVPGAPGRIRPSPALGKLPFCGRRPPGKPTCRKCDLCGNSGHPQTRAKRMGQRQGFPKAVLTK